MRTKIAFLSAAALVAGLLSASAQVYSVNVVGYVNATAPQTNYAMWCNPLDTGNNVLSNVFKGVPGASTLQLWNTASSKWVGYSFSLGNWKIGTVNANQTNLPLGVGFFIRPSATYTNTFVGEVLADAGTSVTNPLTTGFKPVGSLLPYAGTVTNADFNLKVGGASGFQQWSVTGQKFVSFSFNAISKVWKQGTLTTNPVVAVAEGFFLNPSAGTNWVQTLP